MGDVGLRAPLDVEVVDLGVARQLVEVERLQGREPRGVVARRRGRLLHGTRRGATAARATPAAAVAFGVEAVDDVAQFVLREVHDLREVGHRRDLRRRGWRDGRHGRRRGRHSRVRDLVAQERGVVLQDLVDLLVGHADPPAEERIVAVVEAEPFADGGAQDVVGLGSASGHGGVDLHRGRGHERGQLVAHRGQGARRGFGLHGIHADACFHEIDETCPMRQGRAGLCELEVLDVQLLEVAVDGGLQRREVGRRCGRILRRHETAERGLPVEVVALEARQTGCGDRYRSAGGGRRGGRALSASTAASAGHVEAARTRVVAIELGAILLVARHHQAELAGRLGQQRLQITRHRRLILRLQRGDGQRAQGGRGRDKTSNSHQRLSPRRQRLPSKAPGCFNYGGPRSSRPWR